MGECTCRPDEKIYKTKDGFLCIEKWPNCQNCGFGIVVIGYRLKNELIDTKGVLKTLPRMVRNQIQISPIDFKEGIKDAIREALMDWPHELPDDIFDLPEKVIKVLEE